MLAVQTKTYVMCFEAGTIELGCLRTKTKRLKNKELASHKRRATVWLVGLTADDRI